MILVVGATGNLGGAIAKILLSQGREVRILVRRNSPSVELARQGLATSADELIAMGAQPVYGDLKDRASLDSAVKDVHTVITTANSALRGGDDTPETVDAQGNLNLIDAAAQACVHQFIFVSVGPVADPNSPVPFMAAKGKAHLACMSSGMNYTILSPNQFMEVWPAMVVGMPALHGQPVTLVGEARSKIDFISARDVAAYAVASIDNPAAMNQVLALGGPEVLSYRDVVGVYERVLGRTVPVRFVLPGEPVPGLPDSMNAMLSALQSDMVIGDPSWPQKLGIIPTSLEQVVRGMLQPA